MEFITAWLRETTGGLPKVFWYLWSITLIGNIASFVLIFLTFYLQSARGFTAAQVGVVLAVTGVGSVIGSTLGGVLADRWSRRRTAITGYLICMVSLLGTGMTADLSVIVAMMLANGIGISFAGTASSALVTDVVAEADRTRAFSINYWSINIGTSVAALLAPVAMQADFFLLFAFDAAGVAVLAMIMFALIPETRPTADGSEPASPISTGSLRNVLTDRVFLTFVVLFFVFQLVFKQNNAGLPLAVQRDGLDATAYGWIYVVNTLLIVIGQLFLPRLIRDRAHSKVLALGVFLVGAGFGMTALADVAWFYAVTVAVWTLGEMAYFSVLDASVAGLAPRHLRGRYFGVFSSASQLSRFAAPLFAGYLLHSYGELLWIACLVMGVGAAAAYLLTARLREHRIAQLRTTAQRPTAAAESLVGQPG
ncbi:MDR family MFS transporter [Allorhizocola rhizosphaerae]|uniref:MDR family MFS transporter n=1 Tax=Allorhizocola rhizosphaerae TaxID=1872709 RepID=UPI001FEAF06F|nr:MFS transporter [Allorhizocola rhizosphaerae]